eukprot:CAMPEP_0181299598 /NCGR_PEP_ID=MMETSP1101-20121128/6435_1 /TAXON_ID=46948 /ORGANISM="Rhodomonas abbreviata, Strain Caron Lab Isolate" /LENGTH=170 /DNA_ID=CAMNT_0023404765 /DNA_START=629 /DNA_END=1141 /DNA_ORIENTATION=-
MSAGEMDSDPEGDESEYACTESGPRSDPPPLSQPIEDLTTDPCQEPGHTTSKRARACDSDASHENVRLILLDMQYVHKDGNLVYKLSTIPGMFSVWTVSDLALNYGYACFVKTGNSMKGAFELITAELNDNMLFQNSRGNGKAIWNNIKQSLLEWIANKAMCTTKHQAAI